MIEEKVIADPANHDELIEWLQVLYDHVYQLRMKRFIFKTVWTMIEKNPELLQKRESHFYEWFYELYLDGMAMGVRRLCDNDNQTVSLVRFLVFVKRDPSVVSRAAYGDLFPPDTITASGLPKEVKAVLREQMINRQYDSTVGEDVLQPRGKELGREIHELQDLGDTIVNYATKRVAHFDKEPPATYPSLDEVDAFLDHATELIRKYMLLLKATWSDMGIYFQYDWLSPFRTTWLTDELWFGGIFKEVPNNQGAWAMPRQSSD